jgi:hypothetical protein
MSRAVPISALVPDDGALAHEGHDGARSHAPDVTCAEYWSGACAIATIWLAFILYAASRGLG